MLKGVLGPVVFPSRASVICPMLCCAVSISRMMDITFKRASPLIFIVRPSPEAITARLLWPRSSDEEFRGAALERQRRRGRACSVLALEAARKS